MKIAILFATLALIPQALLTSCGTTGAGNFTGPLETVGGYAAGKEYLDRAKTAAAWDKKHSRLAGFNAAVADANRTGITAATLQPAVDAFVKDDVEAMLVTQVLAGFIPANAVLPLNQPDVARFTSGIALALARTNPYVATK